ncbi:DUF3530 family protein [Shewanella aestuarii]|uniref:DUF3530 family protein n=1 Tax=Shewanella aestuarii TaxID=1028752 RepID=A0A6G9QNT0_9GAMM|nr:DUF3530 family protein [Shewanella aestuarii]QIR15707.1 DUF3530 family protein [Shewanella aestuarii]
MLSHSQAKPLFSPIESSEIKQITVDGQTADVLVRPWSGKNQFGAAVIIGASDSQAESMGLAGFLRYELNPKGWATISLPPPKGLYRPNFTTDPQEINKSGEAQLRVKSNSPIPKYDSAQLLELRNFQQASLTEAFNQLTPLGQAFPGARMLIAFDDTAGMITHLLSEKKIPIPDLLVLINPYREYEQLIDEPSQRKPIAEQLVVMSIPILDIISTNGHPLALKDATLRKQYNQVKPIKYYRQYHLDLDLNHPGGWQEAMQKIEGFSRSVIGR